MQQHFKMFARFFFLPQHSKRRREDTKQKFNPKQKAAACKNTEKTNAKTKGNKHELVLSPEEMKQYQTKKKNTHTQTCLCKNKKN